MNKPTQEMLRRPSTDEIMAYLIATRDRLDGFLEPLSDAALQEHWHKITALVGCETAMFAVARVRSSASIAPRIYRPSDTGSEVVSLLATQKMLLRVPIQYTNGKAYGFVPMQRYFWSVDRAIADAKEIVSTAICCRRTQGTIESNR